MYELRADPRHIVRSHFAGYRHARSGRFSVAAALEIFAPPFAAGGLALVFGVNLGADVASGLIAATGLVGAFLFGVMLNIAQRAMEWADSGPEADTITVSRANLLEELAANAGYAALVCLAALVAFTVAAVDSTVADPNGDSLTGFIASVAGFALAGHLIVTLLMVMKRVYAVTVSSLDRVRSGEAEREYSLRR